MTGKVYISEIGVLSPIGNSWSEFEQNMFAGKSGISGIRGKVVDKDFPVGFAGLVDDRNLPKNEQLGLPPDQLTNSLRFSLLTAMQCLEKIPAKFPIDSVVYGTAGGVFFEMVADSFNQLDENFCWDRTRSEFGIEALQSAIESRQKKPIPTKNLISMNSACASGNHAVGLAYQRVKAGEWDRCLVTVVDAGAWQSQIMNFYLLQALTSADVPPEKASAPFSKRRSGFVKSEASASILIESEKAVKERGGKPLAEVMGFGLTSDAYRITDGRDDGLCVSKAMMLAVETAGLKLDQIDYINAHGTSTPLNDRVETMAIKKTFGDRAYKIPVSSLKSQVGHSTVAAGGLETIACVSMLQKQMLAPTINFEEADPDCDLDYVPNQSRPAKVNYILSNNLGFGGQNASLVFGKVENP